jgi:hypothetical protein
VFQVDPVRELAVLEISRTVKVSPDGRAIVAITTDGKVRLWRII